MRSIGPWKPDDSVSCCDKCHEAFTFLRRRHHCRCCGCIFCHQCCYKKTVILDLGETSPQRVCDDCFTMLESRSEQTATRHQAVTAAAALPAWPSHVVVPPLTPTTSDDDHSEGEVSSAIAGVLSSLSDQRQNNSVSFLPVLQCNLVSCDAPNVMNVLLFAGEARYTVNVITVNEGERMCDLVCRLAESYYRLLYGPFKLFTDSQKEHLLGELHFSTDMQIINGNSMALDVASHSRHVVLSTMSLDDLQASGSQIPGGTVSSLRDFFTLERQSPAHRTLNDAF